MSGPTTFSYAQAAKGRVSTQATTTVGTAPPQVDSHTKDDASSVTTGPDASANTFSTTSEVSESAKSSQIDVEVAGPTKISETTGDVNGTTAALQDEAAGTTGAGSETSASSTTASAPEKSARQSNRSGEAGDPKKGRKAKKGRTSDKEPEGEQVVAEPEKEVIPVKLYEAPPPPVNIWQQRAAAAKARQPSVPTLSVVGAESTAKSGPEVSTKTDSNTEPQPSGTAARSSTKPTEASRPTTDSNARRNPRGSRVSEKPEASSNFPSSAVENVSLWPTPETAAAEDGKRKTASEPDKEKQEDGGKATRPKRDWKKVEITPSVVFNTPLPHQRSMNKTRGGAAAQAGRASSGRPPASSISMSSEKAQGGPSDAAAPKEGGGSQERPREASQPRAAPVPSEKAKRFSVDQPTQRKPSVPAVSRDFSTSKTETSKATKSDSNSFVPRGEAQEGFRKEGGFANHKESKPRRGGAHGNGRGAHNGQQSFMPNGHGSRSNTFSPTNFPAPGFSPNTYGGSRGGRGRPVSLANGSGIKTASNGASRVHGPPPHSALPDFGQYPSYGFAPFTPQQDYSANPYPNILHEALKKQIEYYFSDPNLENDGFLKAQMDSQGFVPFEVIAGFPRIRSMSSQTIEFVRLACADCKEVDFVLGDGHKELVRCRKNWQRWVVEGDEKDQTKESARNPGPSNFVYKSWHSLHLNQNNNHYYQQQPMPYSSYNPASPQAFGPGHAFPGDMYPGYMNGPQFPAAVNGAQANGQSTTDNSPLNASVPEFSPVKTSMGFSIAAAFSPMNWEDQAMQSAQTFTDEEVAQLHMVAQGKLANGTRGGPSESEDSAVPKTNGVSTNSEVLTTPELVPTDEGTMSPTYWRLDGTLAHVSDANNKEAYADVHDRAIEQRSAAKSGELPTDMKRLYKFWSHLLTTKFNPGIYMEFRQYALEDATAEVPSKVGLSNLLQFYKAVLSKSQGGGLWPPEHPIYRLLQSHLDNAQQVVNSSEEQV